MGRPYEGPRRGEACLALVQHAAADGRATRWVAPTKGPRRGEACLALVQHAAADGWATRWVAPSKGPRRADAMRRPSEGSVRPSLIAAYPAYNSRPPTAAAFTSH
jgi:hypothetical protein